MFLGTSRSSFKKKKKGSEPGFSPLLTPERGLAEDHHLSSSNAELRGKEEFKAFIRVLPQQPSSRDSTGALRRCRLTPCFKQSPPLAGPDHSTPHSRPPEQSFGPGWSRVPSLTQAETAANCHAKVQQQLAVPAEDRTGSQPGGSTCLTAS